MNTIIASADTSAMARHEALTAAPAHSEMRANLLIGKELNSDDFSEWLLKTKENLSALQTAP
jgi:hypothetical protein